jgi:hypothetical protein
LSIAGELRRLAPPLAVGLPPPALPESREPSDLVQAAQIDLSSSQTINIMVNQAGHGHFAKKPW